MLQHREQEHSRLPARQELEPAVSQRSAEPQSAPTPKKQSRWQALYDEYVTNNPVYWKESQRPDLSALSPKLRAKALANREKREHGNKSPLRNLLESLVGTAIFCLIFWGASALFQNAKIPLAVFFLSPLMGTLGMAAALTRNIILEREKRTWNALLLSHLTPAQILLGKLLPWLRQIAWIAGSMLMFILPGLIKGTVPLWSLAIAIPLVFTAPLPGGIFALRSGLHAESMTKGMGQINKLVVLPLLPNLVAAGAGVAGMLALQKPPYVSLPEWLGVLAIAPWLMMLLNLAWARKLWKVLLRDFHKAPGDFSG